jgi:hypothetical protein
VAAQVLDGTADEAIITKKSTTTQLCAATRSPAGANPGTSPALVLCHRNSATSMGRCALVIEPGFATHG